MTHIFRTQIAQSLGADMTPKVQVEEHSPACLGSVFDVSELAFSSMHAAAAEMTALRGAGAVKLDQRLALMWFGMTLRPSGWDLPSAWDPIAGDYRTADGWIRLHTNAPHHRAAALAVLKCAAYRETVADRVRQWGKTELEAAIVAASGAAAAMHSAETWRHHPQGQAVASEPLIDWKVSGITRKSVAFEGLRVLDLTRVLAGPVATRFLAAFGAQVLRLDPPHWAEPGLEPEVTLGKRCAGLDLTQQRDRQVFERLLREADVVVHGYRPGALKALGYGDDVLHEHAPSAIRVTLNAYGWTGPWSSRRGFDSLVQMSSGIAAEGQRILAHDRPVPLPVQALDHATGYLMAAAVLRALRLRQHGQVMSARLSLARTAHLLLAGPAMDGATSMPPETEADLAGEVERTAWGPARRLKFPVSVEGNGPCWPRPAGPLHRQSPVWLSDWGRISRITNGAFPGSSG